MSGIAGIIHFDGKPVEPGQVEAMTAAMDYRGPDGIHHWRSGNVALGQCMLRSTPESLEETQPLTNEDSSLVLVMDGRVDNWEELRHELLGKGATLRTRADAELVLRSYEVWGRDCLEHIEGDFALVIWDARQREAFCARDRVGNKPFNYHWNGSTLVFSSELHAILALPWVPEVLNQGMLAEYLATEWMSLDETLWRGVLRLKPSHWMTATAEGEMRPHRYWEPDLNQRLPCRTDQDYIEHYRALFTDVVRRMSRANHPLACEVSGGLDSSAIFAVAETLRRQGRLLAPGLEGYTLDYSGVPDADEMVYARSVGAHLGRSIHEVAPAHPPLDWYRDIARRSREFPDYPNGAMGLSIAQTAHSDGCRVLISGTGGDEWAGGCRLYYAEAIAGGNGRELLALLLRDGRAAGFPSALWWAFRHGVLALLPERVRIGLRHCINRSHGPTLPWLNRSMRQRLDERARIPDESPLALAGSRTGQRRQVSNLWRAYSTLAIELNERRASRLALDWRQPYWNSRIIQAAFATPEHLRLRGHQNKWLHCQALAGSLPQRVLTRQDKADFSVAFTRYWDRLMPELAHHIVPRRLEWVGDPAFIRAAAKNFNPGAFVAWTLFGLDAVANTNAGVALTPVR